MRLRPVILVLWRVITAWSASAAALVIQMTGEGSLAGLPTTSQFDVTLTIDDQRADEDPAAGAYLATSHGDVLAVFSGTPYNSTAARIATDSSAGTWNLEWSVLEQGLVIATQIVFTGMRLTPDPVVADFPTVTSGVLTNSTPGSPSWIGAIEIVPAPSTALLVGIDLHVGAGTPAGFESNPLKIVGDDGWLVYFRLQAPEEPCFDKSFKLSDFELVDRSPPSPNPVAVAWHHDSGRGPGAEAPAWGELRGPPTSQARSWIPSCAIASIRGPLREDQAAGDRVLPVGATPRDFPLAIGSGR